ncbi:polysaccharide pyruvyl transferase WcaK-like protein [Prauserella isguenensis]|uniref:Polysaccharide pyruvyl transferase WcaK-like protein n=1 Tax=Prauserella isguenensis TaxID=1470180 RepID=A0A839RZG8_9PSEU|nr:polysaccharide pyruvyl transferase family protein [Prauserella isguenensis]MBB3050856.1 polysaccharide pyruvyl transferase WcaK-like protein [Prauserella isguenensis]
MSHPDSSSARRIYLVAPTGLPNFGDELVAATWLRYLARTEPDAEVWLDCHTPGTAQVMLAGLHPNLRCTNTLWRLTGEAPDPEPWAVVAWIRRVIHDPGLAPRCGPGVELLATADVIHLLGGGYVNALWPRHAGLLAGAVAASVRSGARLAMTGQGLVPAAPHVAELLYALAARFDVVDVRDRDSADLLADGAAAMFTCDDVFLHVPEPEHQDYTRAVMVCVQSDIGELGPPALAARVRGILRRWDVDPGEVTFVEAIPRIDRAVYDLLAADLPGAAFMPFSDLWRDGVPALAGQVWLSTRFHLHLTAAAAGARGVALSVSPDYYDTKHRSLIDLGSGWAMLDAAGADTPELPEKGGFPDGTVAELRARKTEVADRIYGRS